ncbi:penicillin-binding protein 2 [Bacteroidia bacterium]|nr:penicillin-binding protein 2 [Bacteroidia bacterium]
MKDNTFSKRSRISIIFIAVCFSIFIVRFATLQIFSDKYRWAADNNALRNITIYPARGYIYDRNNELLVYNEAYYDLLVIPEQVKELDTAELSKLLGINKSDIAKRLQDARKYSKRLPSVFEKQISKITYASLQEKMYKFKGFYIQVRSLRTYPKPIAAHVLGYIGEVDAKIMKDNPEYKLGDYIGMSGLEKYYESFLKGQKGNKIVMVDVHNKEVGSYQDGKFDSSSVSGLPLYSTLDINIQEFAEQLMKNKRGSVVAIEPSTGEILAFVSSPNYDPNLLVGRERGKNYHKLLNDPERPLFDRALMAQYPPGSIFKLPQALIALQHKVITTNTGFACDKSLVSCHNHPNATCVREGIKMSCNPYFQQIFRRMIMEGFDKDRFIDSRIGLNIWDEDMHTFGFGQRLGIDLPNAKKGLIPDTTLFDKIYGKYQWAFSNFKSVSIGQGEVLLIPLQMANLAAIMANRGFYVTPHLCKKIGDSIADADYITKHYTSVDRKYFDDVVWGMYDAVHAPGGTAHLAKLDTIAVCGKTGTAQNRGKDHAVFIAFAPMDNPKIAISVIVENAGFGGTWSAPIASLIIEKYLTGDIKRKDLMQRMLDANFIKSN